MRSPSSFLRHATWLAVAAALVAACVDSAEPSDDDLVDPGNDATGTDASALFDPALDKDPCAKLAKPPAGAVVASRPLVAFPTPIRLMDGYGDFRTKPGWRYPGEHWPTGADAATSMEGVLDTMNVIGGDTADAAFVKRLRAEGKVFAFHCTDYFPHRKLASGLEDPILAEPYDGVNPSPTHLDYINAKSDYLAEKWARPFLEELGGALPGGFDAIMIDEVNGEDRDGTVSSRLFVQSLRKLRARIGNRRVIVYSTAAAAASGTTIGPFNPSGYTFRSALAAIDTWADLYVVEVYVRALTNVTGATFDALARNVGVRRPTLAPKTIFGLGIGWNYLRYPCGYRVGDFVEHGTPLCAAGRTLLRDQLAGIRAGLHSKKMPGVGFYIFYQADAGTIPVVRAAARDYFP
ncbi:MAG: hypothetical protein IPH44_28175 [Myxococcales bacterium]|nr:hypothetical protein [Myxococcales bacterium]MBK7191541.1 hypothetical protein [Myxococcales bacterium]